MIETVRNKKELVAWLKEKSIDSRLSMSGHLAFALGAMRGGSRPSEDTNEQYQKQMAEIRKMASRVKKARDVLKGEGYYQVIYTVDVGEQFESRV